ncbi:MAG: TolC family protein, partial [Gemmatimonadota bacterium]
MRRIALAVVCLLATTAPEGAAQETEPLETVTLEEAIRRATRFDPEYVAALGRIDNAAWARRAAISQFVLPAIDATASYTEFSSEFFNVGTGAPATRIVQSQLRGSLNLFRGGAKFFALERTGSEIEASVANEVRELYQTALDTETDYYDVLAGQELLTVARERERRAREQLGVARARVVSGAAVQS